MIVITTPTGNIGRQVVQNVLAGGGPIRVVVRDPGRLLPDVRDRVEVVPGSHGDPGVIGRALKGADALFWLLPPNNSSATVRDAYVEFTRPAAQAIRSHGVPRVVGISALGRSTPWADRAGRVTASLAMDDLLASTGAAFRALTLPSFMDNVLRQIRAIKEQGKFYDMLSPDRKLPRVATRDVAGVAARLLLDDRWRGQQEIPLLGPEDLSNNDMAATISESIGTTVRFQQLPTEAFRERLTAAGMSGAMADSMVEMMSAKEAGLDLGVARTPKNGKDTPTTFRVWCEQVLRPAIRAF